MKVDVIEVEDVLCLFAFGSFPLIDNIYRVCFLSSLSWFCAWVAGNVIDG